MNYDTAEKQYKDYCAMEATPMPKNYKYERYEALCKKYVDNLFAYVSTECSTTAVVSHTHGHNENVVFYNGEYKEQNAETAQSLPLDEMIAKTIVNIAKMYPNHAKQQLVWRHKPMIERYTNTYDSFDSIYDTWQFDRNEAPQQLTTSLRLRFAVIPLEAVIYSDKQLEIIGNLND